jgi:hypothetical protein
LGLGWEIRLSIDGKLEVMTITGKKSIAQAKVRGETVLADSLQAVSAKYDLKKP